MSFMRLCTFLAASLIAAPVAATEIHEVTSPSGIKAWLVEDHSIPFVSVTILFRGGASVDAPDKRGAINLMTALLEEGAELARASGQDVFALWLGRPAVVGFSPDWNRTLLTDLHTFRSRGSFSGLVPHLADDGMLYTGHSENYLHAADIIQPCGRTLYRRAGTAA